MTLPYSGVSDKLEFVKFSCEQHNRGDRLIAPMIRAFHHTPLLQANDLDPIGSDLAELGQHHRAICKAIAQGSAAACSAAFQSCTAMLHVEQLLGHPLLMLHLFPVLGAGQVAGGQPRYGTAELRGQTVGTLPQVLAQDGDGSK